MSNHDSVLDRDVVVKILDDLKSVFPALNHHSTGSRVPMIIAILPNIGPDTFRELFDTLYGSVQRYSTFETATGELVVTFAVSDPIPQHVQHVMTGFENALNDAMLSVAGSSKGMTFEFSGENLDSMTYLITPEEYEGLSKGQKFNYILRHGTKDGKPIFAGDKVKYVLGYGDGPKNPQEWVSKVNAVAGVQRNNRWVDIERQIMMAYEEFENELLVDLKNRDLDKFRDSLADVLVFLFGVASVSSIDVTADLKAVTDALLSRFDLSMSDAMITHQKYADQGVETQVRVSKVGETEYFVNFSAKDQTGRSGEFIKEGKWLKSYKHHAPTLPELCSIPE